jgi:hypothetical protein
MRAANEATAAFPVITNRALVPRAAIAPAAHITDSFPFFFLPRAKTEKFTTKKHE